MVWVVEVDQQIVGWVVDLEADLRKVGYSGGVKSERLAGGRIGQVHWQVGGEIVIEVVDHKKGGWVGEMKPTSKWERR